MVAKLRQTEILREAPVATAQQGRGNNWAFGFHGLSKLKRRKRDGPQWVTCRAHPCLVPSAWGWRIEASL